MMLAGYCQAIDIEARILIASRDVAAFNFGEEAFHATALLEERGAA
jgi:hypothetical protein